MDRFQLTNEGRARIKRSNIDGDSSITRMNGYEVLNYLYKNGAGTIEEIKNYTGLSWSQAQDKLWAFINWGYVAKLAEQ